MLFVSNVMTPSSLLIVFCITYLYIGMSKTNVPKHFSCIDQVRYMMFTSALQIIYFMPCPWGRKFLLDLAHSGSHCFLSFLFLCIYLMQM